MMGREERNSLKYDVQGYRCFLETQETSPQIELTADARFTITYDACELAGKLMVL